MRNTRQLSLILNNLLYLQEVRSSEIRRTPIIIHDTLRQLIAEMQSVARTAELELVATIAPTGAFSGDSIGLGQAFRALIDNAIKFTPAGGRVVVQVSEQGRNIILRVEDNGIGIAAEHHQKIFVPFYRVDDSLARPYAGAGLGLAIVKHVVEAHDGSVSLSSTPGQGSCFTVVLPRPAG
ncbi:MAG TPA: ATP-binding protein, partial [Roseiflexaceae bacterium]|nr:ATP-binding protein [Roseiflexaceae bacterium]